ncbi:MAG: helix-turn-helix domain-containing protein [Coprococcus catus]
MAKLTKDYQCSLQLLDALVGGKWKLRIIFYLLSGTKRFSELAKMIPGITQKTLTQQLRELEEVDIVTRTIYAEMPPRVEYSLTEYGKSMEIALRDLSAWAHRYAIAKGIDVSTKVNHPELYDKVIEEAVKKE